MSGTGWARMVAWVLGVCAGVAWVVAPVVMVGCEAAPCVLVAHDADHETAADAALLTGADYSAHRWTRDGVTFGWSAEEDSMIWDHRSCILHGDQYESGPS